MSRPAFFLCALLLAGCGSDDARQPAADNAKSASSTAEIGKQRPSGIDPAAIPVPRFQTGVCRVYTPEPGFVVFVDGEMVRDEKQGEPLKTPCAVTLPVGNHDLKVARAGYRDTPLPGRVRIFADGEIEAVLEPMKDPLGIAASVLDAPYLHAKVGVPIALDALNSSGLETDPFVTPDGRAIYFAADRSEGKGIYYATRSSPYDEFGPPTLLIASRGSEGRATPSVTGDARVVAFALPDNQRVLSLSRESPLGDFLQKQTLASAARADQRWCSAQLLADGLRLYWTIEADGKLETRLARRKSRDDRFADVFRVRLPGRHPCLANDGLRQYVFDGQTLSRARRIKVSSKFSRLEAIAVLELEKYVHDSRRRQFFVSDDEQWLYYCDDPANSGDLYVVRLSQGPAWGFAALGSSIPQRTFAAAGPPETPEAKPKPEQPAGDPRTRPLPYTVHWQRFRKLIEAKQYTEAKQLVAQSLGDPKLAKDRELLEWDRGDLERIVQFWNDVRTALGGMKPGDELSFGPVEVTLVKFDDDRVTARTRNNQLTKAIHELDPLDLASLADRVVEKTNEAGQVRIGTFLFYDTGGTAGSAKTRFARAGTAGTEFYERQAARLLHQTRQEFERENIAAGLAIAKRAAADFPGTKGAEQAAQLERDAYTFTKWQQRGRWEKGEAGEYIAPRGRAANSYLVSPRPYENYELRLEFKLVPRGAGGVFFRYRGARDPNLFGYKIQLTDDFGSGRLDPQTTGALMNEAPPLRNAVRQAGEWNSLRMQVRGPKVTVEINGTKVLDRIAQADDFKRLGGYVMLDGVAGGITYRKTLLLELTDDE